MFFIGKFFALGQSSLTPAERQKEKVRLENLYRYYKGKLDYLSGRRISPQLALMACNDAPMTPRDYGGKSGAKKYLNDCKKYYKQKLKEVNAGIKKVS